MPKISELPLANKLKEEDYIPIVQDGVTKKVKGTHFVTEEEYSLDAFSPTIVANDKAMYKFGEGDSVDFSDSAYDGAYKSAILKGQTLVNLCKTKGKDLVYTDTNSTTVLNHPIENNKWYYMIINVKQNTFEKPFRFSGWSFANGCKKMEGSQIGTTDIDLFNAGETGVKGFKLGYSEIVDGLGKTLIMFVVKHSGETLTGKIVYDIMFLEYQEGMENWDIPYFTGMNNVKMPVLKSRGKNLFDYKSYGGQNMYVVEIENGLRVSNWAVSLPFTHNLLPNTAYTTKAVVKVVEESVGATDVGAGKIYIYNGKIYFPLFAIDGREYTFTTPSDIKSYDRILFYAHGGGGSKTGVVDITNIQLEETSTATTYEPYKSNILTVNEPVELRKINGVQDELDLLTGELTQRIGAVVLDGSDDESWNVSNNPNGNVFFNITIPSMQKAPTTNKSLIVCDKLKVASLSNTWGGLVTNAIAQASNHNYLQVSLDTNVLPNQTITSFKTYLTQNPITVQYPLTSESIKTVDLSGVPFGYKGGHIIKSSAEGSLLPKFEYEVAVSRGAQISQNTSTLIKHDEKITELLRKTAAVYINQKVKIANLLNEIGTQDKVQTIPLVDMTDSDMVLDNMGVEHEIEIIENPDSLLINLIYDLIELNDTFELLEKVEVLRRSGLIDKQNYEVIKVKLNGAFEGE